MNHLTLKSPPVREIRLKAGIAHHGSTRTLERGLGDGCLANASRSFYQSCGCQFTLSLALLNTFLRAVVILHGPVGCGTCSIANVGAMKSFKRLRDPGAGGLVFLNTNLGETDVIGGGEGKLAEAILHSDREFRPEIILVAIGCVPSLIGDDVDAVADGLRGEVSAEIVPIHCSGFKSKVMATAYDDVYHGVLTRLVRERVRPGRAFEDEALEREERVRRGRTVNIMNVTSMARQDELELQRLVNALDLDCRFLVCYGGVSQFADALESSLNVSICGTHDDYFLGHLQSVHGIPFILDTMPIGPRNTARWLERIGGFFGRGDQARRVAGSEAALLEDAVAPLRAGFEGKRAYLAGGELRIVATAELLRYLGLGILGLKAHHIDRFVAPALEQLDGHEEIPFIVATQQPFEHVNIVKRLKPDVFVGHTGGNNLTSKLGLPILPLFSNTAPYMGYAGAFEVARRLKRILKNPSFNRNLARHCPLPFRDSWYAADPFRYVKDGSPESKPAGPQASAPPKAGEAPERKKRARKAAGK